MKIATWNVNSIRSRLPRLLAWLATEKPDVVCLQETKAIDAAFPFEPLRQAGYDAATLGQRTYNGVAILTRAERPEAPGTLLVCPKTAMPQGKTAPDKPVVSPCQNIRRGLAGWDDVEARAIWADVGGLTVASLYVPNGQTVGSDKYAYKLRWMRQLVEHLRERFTPSTPLVLCGDFNVARDAADVARPEAWEGSVLFDDGSRAALEQTLDWGLVDVLRQQHPEGGLYSWWDYRRMSFPKNDGLRLDYILATEPIAGRCKSAIVDRDQRKGELPSDHAPVLAEFEL